MQLTATSPALEWAVADAYDTSTVPAFMARWWGKYAIARDPKLDAHVIGLEHRAADSTDLAEAKALLEEVSHIRYQAQRLKPGLTDGIDTVRAEPVTTRLAATG